MTIKIKVKIYICIIFFLLILSSCAIFGIKPKYIQNWSDAKTGMKKEDIKNILGNPDTIIYNLEYKEDQNLLGKIIVNFLYDGWYEKWCYGKNSILTSNFLLPFGPHGDIYIVYFNKEGKVVGFRQPKK
jgi:outer membrane protein assembly factor BamE (lipoprotein component of BamABCDE complex)